MPFGFAVVLVFLLVSALFVLAALAVGALIRPRIPEPEKGTTYECGERPIGSGWFNFNPRFYRIALLFIVFDVEVALTFPVAVVVRNWIGAGAGLQAIVEIVLFLAVLAAALAFVWGKGDLDWARNLDDQEEDR